MAEGGSGGNPFNESQRALVASMRFVVCVADFYEELAKRLVQGASDGFRQLGVEKDRVWIAPVAGAFELPFAAKLFALDGRFDGIVCVGAVIRGETDHYDFVCAEAARGIQDVQLETGVPCAFGVLTCDTMEQALARSNGDKRDQGGNAAVAVVRAALMKRELENSKENAR